MAYSIKIGDSQPAAVAAVVAAFPISVVTQAEIANINSAINNTLVSGKKAGACYIMKETTGGAYVMVIAEGSSKNSRWRKQYDKVAIIPA